MEYLLYVFPFFGSEDTLLDCFRGLIFKIPATVKTLRQEEITNNTKMCRHQGVLFFVNLYYFVTVTGKPVFSADNGRK
jgi:hypothetical protein